MSALLDTLSDSRVLMRRGLLHTRRDAESLMVALLLPIAIMVMFVYVLGGAMETGTTYANYVVPGVLVICATFGASMTAVSVAADLQHGIVDRFASMPISARSVLVGHVGAGLVRNLVATTLVVGVGLAVGWRPTGGVLAWLLAIGVIIVFIVTISWLAAAAGLLMRTPEAANGALFPVLFLPYLSTAFVPAETLPRVLQGFAEHQPFTSIIETLRALWMDQPLGDHLWWALGWCAALLAIGVVAAGRLFSRRVST